MKERNICPLEGKIICKRLDDFRKTASGIIIPETYNERSMLGQVVAVRGEELTGLLNRHVLFGRAAPTNFQLDGEMYCSVKEEEILALVDLELNEITPTDNFVLLEKEETSKIMYGNLSLDIGKSKKHEVNGEVGKVLAVGSAVKDIEVGDRVIYPPYVFYLLKAKGDKDKVILKAEDIWLKYE